MMIQFTIMADLEHYPTDMQLEDLKEVVSEELRVPELLFIDWEEMDTEEDE